MVEHPAFNRLVLSSNLRRPIKHLKDFSIILRHYVYELLKNYFFWILIICSCSSVNAGLNNFTDLIFVEDWLIERKIDLNNNETKCRASIPSQATWFGARVRLGSNNEVIKPIWISLKEDQLLDSKLAKVRKILYACRSMLFFLPESL